MLDHAACIHDLTARGLSAESAATIAACLQNSSPHHAWSHISQNLLTTAHDFALHSFLYEQCYGENALLRSPGPAWLPTADIIARANITAALQQLHLPDYPALHQWSVEHKAAYWDLAIRRLNILFRQPYSRTLDASDPTRPQWLIGAQLNIVDSCFQADPSAPAILQSDGAGPIATTTCADLRALTARAANALIAAGISPGDAVAIVAPMTAASVAAYLAIIAIGAAVVSIADSFAPEEISARLRIAAAKLIITQDVIHWGPKTLPLYEKIAAATTLPIMVMSSDATDCQFPIANFRSAIGNRQSAITPLPRHPHDPINILFSSGTTGEPKAIPWDHTTPIKAAADAHFHHDLHPGDVACWPTNLGWMMGPWLIFATLLNRAAMALFTQAPHGRPFGQFVQNARVSMLGCVPSLVRAWRHTHCMRGLDWSHIRAFSSSGECSNAADMLYLMHLAGYRPIIEYCGGTEIGGAYITSTIVQPNIPAAFTTPALGLDFAIFNGAQSAPAGEVFIAGPSLGLSTRLLNRDHHAIYFDNTPTTPAGTPLRRHGDELETLPPPYKGYRVAGRSDDTMNLAGIKVACAEIERVLATLPQIQETAAIALPPPGGGPSRLTIFAVLRPAPPNAPGAPPADPTALKSAMQSAIRTQLNPLFHIDTVHVLPSLPRTASNKILRRQLRSYLAAPAPQDHHR